VSPSFLELENVMHAVASPADISLIQTLREEELEEARSIQSVMLPSQPLCTGEVTICHAFQPVAEVGGDFLDYFQLADGSVGLYLGDVSGKGLPAAMYAALAVGTLRGVHKTGQSPAHVLATLNRRLMIRGAPRRHAAVQYAVFDPQSREMQIASAGMPGPFHVSSNECRVLTIEGMPPGLFDPSVTYETQTTCLAPGDWLLFFTDGLPDAFDMQNECFGIERMQAFCESHCGKSPEFLLTQLFSEVKFFARGRLQHDDMAAAIFRYDP
jgi:sigma-B regulation protein RsbU (phosphoserine phosphatase)